MAQNLLPESVLKKFRLVSKLSLFEASGCWMFLRNQDGVRFAHRTDLCFSIWRFSQVVFIPRAQPHAQSLFLFPIGFGINPDILLDVWRHAALRLRAVCFSTPVDDRRLRFAGGSPSKLLRWGGFAKRNSNANFREPGLESTRKWIRQTSVSFSKSKFEVSVRSDCWCLWLQVVCGLLTTHSDLRGGRSTV